MLLFVIRTLRTSVMLYHCLRYFTLSNPLSDMGSDQIVQTTAERFAVQFGPMVSSASRGRATHLSLREADEDPIDFNASSNSARSSRSFLSLSSFFSHANNIFPNLAALFQLGVHNCLGQGKRAEPKDKEPIFRRNFLQRQLESQPRNQPCSQRARTSGRCRNKMIR